MELGSARRGVGLLHFSIPRGGCQVASGYPSRLLLEKGREDVGKKMPGKKYDLWIALGRNRIGRFLVLIEGEGG